MPPTPPPEPGSVRPATVVNAEIRALWSEATGGHLTPEQRTTYTRLLAEWAKAVRAEQALAA